MSYVVKKIDKAQLQDCHEQGHERSDEFAVSYRYPKTTFGKESRKVVVTTLVLFKSEEEPRAEGFWAGLKSLFERDTPTYKVILHQEHKEGHPQIQGFVLFEGNGGEEDVARKALEELHLLLTPLVKGGQVKLTEALLEELVLPKPVEVSGLAHYLVEVVRRRSDAHHDWTKIFNAILAFSCTNDNLEEAKLLYENGANLDEADGNGDTPIHVAVASRSNSVLGYLLTKTPSSFSLHRQNSQGLSPLDIANLSRNQEAVESLLRAKSKLNPLHHAATLDRCDRVWALIEEEGGIPNPSVKKKRSTSLQDLLDQFDANGYTPLMLAAQSASINSCLYLLLGGANPNIRHQITGDTSLHMAASVGNVTIVKILTVFEAEIAATNHSKETPWDKAKDEKIKAILGETAMLRKQARELYSRAPPFTPPAEKIKSKYLLSYDGGGVRNIASCQILGAIEKRMRQLQPNCPPLPHFFQHFVGTSSGGAGVLFLTYRDIPLNVCLGLILRFVTEVFEKPLSGREQAQTDYLKDVFGEDLAMSHLVSPKVMVTTTLANRNPPQLHLIRSYKPPLSMMHADVQYDPSEWKVWQAVRATSAAPLYFPPFEDCYLDGGLVSNNPTLDALAEIVELAEEKHETPSLGLVLSLGAGIPPSEKVDIIDFSFGTIASLPSNVRSARSLLQLLVTQVTKSDGQEVTRARAWCKSLGVPYFRFSPPLAKEISLAETKFPIIIDLFYDTQRYIFKNASEIDSLARVILQGSPAQPCLSK